MGFTLLIIEYMILREFIKRAYARFMLADRHYINTTEQYKNGLQHQKMYLRIYAPSVDSYQPAYSHSLIRNFAMYMKRLRMHSLMILYRASMSEGKYSDVVTHSIF